MRGVLILLAMLAAAPAAAAPLAVAEDQPVRFDNLPGTQSHLRRQIFHEVNDTAAPRHSMSDDLASQLGVQNGRMQLFSRRMDDSADHGATLDGGIDGSGFKLKLSW